MKEIINQGNLTQAENWERREDNHGSGEPSMLKSFRAKADRVSALREGNAQIEHDRLRDTE